MGNSLSVYQMTRRIVSDSPGNLPGGRTNAAFDQELRNISDLGAEFASAISKQRIIGKKALVFFHRRSATRSIHDDSIDSAFQKSLDVSPGKLLRHIELSRVSVQGAAAHLSLRFNKSAAVTSQHAFGGSISFAKESLHHAPAEQRNAQVIFTFSVEVPGGSCLASRDSQAAGKQERQRKAC